VPPVRAQLEVHAGDPATPERATLELTRELLASFPRRRPVTFMIVGFAPHPGLTPTPWALDGVLAACVEAERMPVQFVSLADPETAEMLLRRAARTRVGGAEARDLIERPSRDRSATIRCEGQQKPFVVPRELIGSSLILLAPMLVRAHEHNHTRHWQGPLALALEQLAFAWGYTRPAAKLGESTATALELIAASFASAAVIVDATWAGALEQPRATNSVATRGSDGRFVRGSVGSTSSMSELPRLLGELDSPDRSLALAHLEQLGLDAVLGVDQGLVRALGLSRRISELPIPNVSSRPSGAEHRWPQLLVTDARAQPTKLADRAISGIRSQSQRLASGIANLARTPARDSASRSSGAERPALPARVPGRFAQQWTARWYGEHDRMPR
jgi:hypothetical protein